MNRFLILFVWVLSVAVVGCRPNSGLLPSTLAGTYTLYAPFYQNGATINFKDGTYTAQGKVENSEFGTMEFSGHFAFSGDKLHLTFDEVSTNSASETNKVTKDLLEDNAERFRKVKGLDFIVVAKNDGVLALTSGSHGPGPIGEVNFILDPGNSALGQGVSVSISWLPSFDFATTNHKVGPRDSGFNPAAPAASEHRRTVQGGRHAPGSNDDGDQSQSAPPSSPPDSQGSDPDNGGSDPTSSGDPPSGNGIN